MGITRFFEVGATDFEDAVLAFLKGNKLLTDPSTAATLFGHILFGSSYLFLEETGGKL